MKCLVVVTHPLSDSLCSYLGKHIIDRLNSEGHTLVEESLYESGYNPVLSQTERLTYYESSYESSGVSAYSKRLVEAEAIVLVYPTWWFGFPAILKGWFDRVWGPGISFDHAENYGSITPRLVNLRKVLVVTTLGSPWWVDLLVMRQPLKKVVRYALLGTCAKDAQLSYISLYKAENISETKIAKFVARIDRVLASWV